MKKRIISTMLTLAMVGGLTACGGDKPTVQESAPTTVEHPSSKRLPLDSNPHASRSCRRAAPNSFRGRLRSSKTVPMSSSRVNSSSPRTTPPSMLLWTSLHWPPNQWKDTHPPVPSTVNRKRSIKRNPRKTASFRLRLNVL